jgi:predicted transcriptional regulator
MNPEPAEQEAEEADTGRKMDAEIRTISGIIRTLNDLDEAARRRVVAYIASRYVEGRP